MDHFTADLRGKYAGGGGGRGSPGNTGPANAGLGPEGTLPGTGAVSAVPQGNRHYLRPDIAGRNARLRTIQTGTRVYEFYRTGKLRA